MDKTNYEMLSRNKELLELYERHKNEVLLLHYGTRSPIKDKDQFMQDNYIESYYILHSDYIIKVNKVSTTLLQPNNLSDSFRTGLIYKYLRYPKIVSSILDVEKEQFKLPKSLRNYLIKFSISQTLVVTPKFSCFKNNEHMLTCSVPKKRRQTTLTTSIKFKINPVKTVYKLKEHFLIYPDDILNIRGKSIFREDVNYFIVGRFIELFQDKVKDIFPKNLIEEIECIKLLAEPNTEYLLERFSDPLIRLITEGTKKKELLF